MTTSLATRVGTSIEVDGLVISDLSPIGDELGNEYVLTSLSGWFAGVDVRAGAVARLSDGDFDGDALRSSRTITIGGALISSTRGDLLRGMDRLSAVLAGSVRRGRVIVTEQEQQLSRAVDARLGGPTMITRKGARHADFSIVLYCADPLRYSLDEHSVTLSPGRPGAGRAYPLTHPRMYGALGTSGRVNAHNNGDARTHPIVTFVGPCANPTVNDADSTLRLGMTLLTGQSVVVDCAQRTVIFGNASRRHFLTSDPSWLALGAGDNLLNFSTDDDDGTVIVSWRDAWS